MTNLIVGGTGFAGGHLCEYFFAEGEISKGIFRKGSHLRIMDQCGVQCLEAELTNRATLHEPLDMVDTIYNVAFPPPGRPGSEYSSFNQEGLMNLLMEAAEHGVKTFVHLSCLDVYGSGRNGAIAEGTNPAPTTSYQVGKFGGEQVIESFVKTRAPDMRVRIVRAARATGPRDTALAGPLLKMISDGKLLLPPGSSARISFSHPKDIAQALRGSAASGSNGLERYLVKSFDASLEELAEAIASATRKQVVVRRAGLFSGKTLIPPWMVEQLKSEVILSDDVRNTWKKINYTPAYGLEKVAGEISEWYRKEPWLAEDLA